MINICFGFWLEYQLEYRSARKFYYHRVPLCRFLWSWVCLCTSAHARFCWNSRPRSSTV